MASYAVLAWEITNTTDDTKKEITTQLHAAVPRAPFGIRLNNCVTISMGEAEFTDMGRKLAAISTTYWAHFTYRAFLVDGEVPALPLLP